MKVALVTVFSLKKGKVESVSESLWKLFGRGTELVVTGFEYPFSALLTKN